MLYVVVLYLFALGSVACHGLFTLQAVTMNLTRRQPLFKDVHNLFRFRRTQFSNTYAIQFNRAEIICKRSMSSETRTQTVDVPVSLEQEVVDSDLSMLTPVCY